MVKGEEEKGESEVLIGTKNQICYHKRYFVVLTWKMGIKRDLTSERIEEISITCASCWEFRHLAAPFYKAMLLFNHIVIKGNCQPNVDIFLKDFDPRGLELNKAIILRESMEILRASSQKLGSC